MTTELAVVVKRFAIQKTWAKCPLSDERINKMCNTYEGMLFSLKKEWNSDTLYKWINCDNMLNKPDTK